MDLLCVFVHICCSIEAEEQMRVAWTPKCCFVVKEIMQTEIAYVQALADIIKVSHIPTEISKSYCGPYV